MRYLLALICTLAVAFPVAAQDSGFYAGGHIGQATAKDSCDNVAGPGVSCDDEDTAWKILGGYQLNRNLGIEVGYTDLGEVSASGPGGTASVEAKALELVGVGSLPLGERFSVYGKAGVYRGETDATASTALLTGSFSETNNDLTFGVGARYDLTRNIALRAEWQRYADVGGGDIGESDVDVLSVGALFRF